MRIHLKNIERLAMIQQHQSLLRLAECGVARWQCGCHHRLRASSRITFRVTFRIHFQIDGKENSGGEKVFEKKKKQTELIFSILQVEERQGPKF